MHLKMMELSKTDLQSIVSIFPKQCPNCKSKHIIYIPLEHLKDFFQCLDCCHKIRVIEDILLKR